MAHVMEALGPIIPIRSLCEDPKVALVRTDASGGNIPSQKTEFVT